MGDSTLRNIELQIDRTPKCSRVVSSLHWYHSDITLVYRQRVSRKQVSHQYHVSMTTTAHLHHNKQTHHAASVYSRCISSITTVCNYLHTDTITVLRQYYITITRHYHIKFTRTYHNGITTVSQQCRNSITSIAYHICHTNMISLFHVVIASTPPQIRNSIKPTAQPQ